MTSHELQVMLSNRFESALETVKEFWEQNPMASGTYGRCVMAFTPFCELMTRRHNESYGIAAEIIGSELDNVSVPRGLRSVILTALARWTYESVPGKAAIQGRIVSHFGQILSHSAKAHPEMYVEWFEDMGHGIPLAHETGEPPEQGYYEWLLAPQPTRVLRGILFASRLREGVMDEFWRRAARSEFFPERIFTDPGDFEDQACLLTPMQLAQLAVFYTHAPEEAVQRFARVFAEHVRTMRCVVYARLTLPGGAMADVGVCDPPDKSIKLLFGNLGEQADRICWEQDASYVELEVTEEKRIGLLKAVLGMMQDEDRRRLVRQVFGV